MTVADLIKLLGEKDPSKPVLIWHPGTDAPTEEVEVSDFRHYLDGTRGPEGIMISPWMF